MLNPIPGEMIAVWFSCGAASAVVAKKTIERYGDTCKVRVVYNPVLEEDQDNLRFLKEPLKEQKNRLKVLAEMGTNHISG